MEDSKELAEFLQTAAPVEVFKVGVGNQEVEVMSVPQGRHLKSIKPFLDEYRISPERRKGNATFSDLPSLIAHVNRFKDEHSALFASRDPNSPRIIAVLNYNEGEGGNPRFGDHRSIYAFPLSKEWKSWHGRNGQKMGQAEFAEFIENHILDVIPPPADEAEDSGLIQLVRTLGGSFATPSKLMEMSRGMAINASEKVRSAISIGTGEVQVLYEEVHSNDKGKPLSVPSLFVIAIPVFENGPLYRVAARLRYRLKEGVLTWFYELFRADKSFDHAFNEACDRSAAETELPLFFGTPEA